MTALALTLLAIGMFVAHAGTFVFGLRVGYREGRRAEREMQERCRPVRVFVESVEAEVAEMKRRVN